MKTILHLVAMTLLAVHAVHAVNLDAEGPTTRIGKWQFPASYTADGTSMTRLGGGELRYWGFRLYSAALYRAPTPNAPKRFIDRQTLLVIRYNRKIRAGQIIEAAETNLGKNPTVNKNTIRPKLKRMYDAFLDVENGDEYALLYMPEKGTHLLYNGRLKTQVPGFEFARDFFGIWLSNHPINDDLKRELWENKGL